MLFLTGDMFSLTFFVRLMIVVINFSAACIQKMYIFVMKIAKFII